MLYGLGIGVVAVSVGITMLVYGIYIMGMSGGGEREAPREVCPPQPVSIIIPAYNEERVIARKIKNLAEIDYPSSLMEIIVIDDCSGDRTRQEALSALAQYGMKGEVITNERRQGTNANYNCGFERARNDLIIATDADVLFEKDAVRYIVNALCKEPQTGAVCGELVPLIEKQSISAGIEKPYREVFGKICGWESSLHSTYCFNGPLIGVKREAIGRISPTKGASDTNIALCAIKKGYRAKYVPYAKFYECIPHKHIDQRKQKIRRATRLLESTWSARGCLFNPRYGKFGMVVLPLRFAMFFIVPCACVLAGVILVLFGFMLHPLYGISFLGIIGVIFMSARWRATIVSSFLWHNYYLFMGLLRMGKSTHMWDSIDRSLCVWPKEE
ncbi:MAG: glycosyltransferase [bacterium]